MPDTNNTDRTAGITEFLETLPLLVEPGRLTLAQGGRILTAVAGIAVQLAEGFATTGPAKKTWVMERVQDVLDVIVPSIPLPIWLRPFAPIVRSVATRCLLALADGIVEATVSALHAKPLGPPPEPSGLARN